jgi:hypothetical protein
MATEESLEKLRQDYEPSEFGFGEMLKGKIKAYSQEDRERDWLQYTKFVMGEKFFQGEQFGRVSKFDGSWRTRKKTEGDPLFSHNYVRGHATAILTQWVQSRTEVTVVPLPDGDAYDQNKGSGKVAKSIIDHYDDELLDEKFKQRECMYGQITGQLLRYTFWNPKKGKEVERPEYENEAVEGVSTFTCADCGMSGGLEELDAGSIDGDISDGLLAGHGGDVRLDEQSLPEPNQADAQQEMACPHCGSTDLIIEEGEQSELPKISGYDKVKTGDVDVRGIPRYQVKFDQVPNDFKQIQWLRWREKARPETIRAELPNFGSARSGGESDDPGTRATEVLAQSVGNIFGGHAPFSDGTKGERDLVTVDRWWFKPSCYCDYVFKADYKLSSGQVVPAGTKAHDIFPNGLFVLVVADEIVDFRNEDLHRHWVHTPMILVPSRIDGDGLLDDLIEPQQEANALDGLSYANARYVAGSGLIYRPEFISRTDIPNKPFDAAPIKPGTDPTIPLQNMMMYLPRPDLGQGVYVHKSQLLEFMQWSTKNYSTSVGAPDQNIDTASGQQIASQASRSQRAPELALYAQMVVDWMTQVLILFQENATDAMYFPHKGKVGEMDGQWFKGSDIPSSFVLSLVPRSYIPKSEMERRQDLMGFLGMFGGLAGLIMAMQSVPELVEEAKERFNISFDIKQLDLTATVARQRLEAMKPMVQQAEAASGVIGEDPASILISVQGAAPDKDDDHPAMIQWWIRWKHEDEGVKARIETPSLYAAADAMIMAHKQLMVVNEQEKQQLAIAAQGPQMELQQQQQAEQQAMQQQGQEEAASAEHSRQMEQKESDAVMSDAQMANAAATSERQHQQAMQIQAMKQQGAENLAKAKQQGASK